jgi:hypothetical protein
MNETPENSTAQDGEFFRIPVVSENNEGVIRVGRQKAKVSITETSIDGFTVVATPRNAKKMQSGGPWVLEYDEARTEIHPQWIFNAPDGRVQMGLRRLRDLTKPPSVKPSLLSRFIGGRAANPSISASVYGGFVLVLFAMLAMPGIGDQLGTSRRIQDAFQMILNGLNETVGQYL